MDFIRHHASSCQCSAMEQRVPYFGACVRPASFDLGLYTEDYMLQAAPFFQYEENEAPCRSGEISILGGRTRSTPQTG